MARHGVRGGRGAPRARGAHRRPGPQQVHRPDAQPNAEDHRGAGGMTVVGEDTETEVLPRELPPALAALVEPEPKRPRRHWKPRRAPTWVLLTGALVLCVGALREAVVQPPRHLSHSRYAITNRSGGGANRLTGRNPAAGLGDP